MDYFCKECSGKPGWPWDSEKVFSYSCQRCFRFLPCNDYSWRKPKVTAGPAPTPKDLVATNVSSQSECTLPLAKGHTPPAVPVYPVAPPPDFQSRMTSPDGRNEADMALDAIQPNRPGVKLTARGGKAEPKFEVAEGS